MLQLPPTHSHPTHTYTYTQHPETDPGHWLSLGAEISEAERSKNFKNCHIVVDKLKTLDFLRWDRVQAIKLTCQCCEKKKILHLGRGGKKVKEKSDNSDLGQGEVQWNVLLRADQPVPVLTFLCFSSLVDLCALLNIAVASDEITLYTSRGRYSASRPIISHLCFK